MIVCAAGDIHGAINRIYEDILAFEAALGATFAWVLQVGDFGIWPDPDRIDRATRNHEGVGDFPEWLAAGRAVPRPTVFVKGNHEDFAWLDNLRGGEALPGLHHLRNGGTIGLPPSTLRVGGIGGCHSPSDFGRRFKDLEGYAKRHYTSDEIELLPRGRIDVLLLHDAPVDVRSHACVATGLDTLVGRVRPRVCLFGHHHMRIDAEVAGVRCIGLNKVGRLGNLVAIEFDCDGLGWEVVGEWPKRRESWL